MSAAGIERTDSITTKFVSHVGFSYGIAELTLKKPPPLVPSILIDSWLATGPRANVCARPVSPVAWTGPPRVCRAPWLTRNSPSRTEIGRRT